MIPSQIRFLINISFVITISIFGDQMVYTSKLGPIPFERCKSWGTIQTHQLWHCLKEVCDPYCLTYYNEQRYT